MRAIWRTLLLAALALACAHTPELTSHWPTPPIAVDGAYSEWSGRLVRIDDERSVALGVANDRANLYLCLVTRDLDVQTLIERLGFTLWVDPAGGERKQIGFRVAPFQAGATTTAPAYVEIVQHGAEYGEQLVGSAQAPIDVEASARADVVAYEIRIALGTPLSGSSDLAGVTLSPGARIGLGFETEALTSRRRTRVPAQPQQEPAPSPGPQPHPGDPRYEEPEQQGPLELPRARKIAPLSAWVVATLATAGPDAK
ncbi:MAG TPA: hypothetical protein VKH41_09020 [Myxococcota bacterium]|nr:hypothetical protein [Myxococcota bacterium]